ncbi:TonB-dependent receptor domain-containing protein [Stutzerimonas stutzeri]|uniref:TonB-dependent receptor domain-containing protein n=1 Tax=Stutzerimonas stutzeri TaxID=316 RepID=UPI0005F0DA6B|nr:TonB-dependent receptor [Stutzerimonas stutzeri]MCP3431276.1 TonB-dependent receptor [Stutzerimonas stutzeri]OWG37887.1 TonB-dependent receptor [Stutzerimonas stutzeri]
MKLSPLALAIALTPGLALAQTSSREDALKLSDTLITANRDVQQRSDSSAASTVFTREDIDRLQPSSVSELLNRVPGVQVIQNGGRGTSSSLFIRGTSSAQSLVLVDGQRIGSASAGGSPLEYLNVEQIERIEVLRGPRSAVYGADAIGGVVQIFTRRASGEGLNPRLRLGYGSRNTWERSLGLSGGNESTRFSLSASADDTRGINHTDSRVRPDSDHDAYRNNAFSLNLNHRFNERLEGGFSVLDQRGESEFDYGSYGAYPYSDFQLSSYSGFLSANINERWTSRVELGHSENRYIERADDVSLSGPFSTYRDSASWLNTLALGSGQSLLLGFDWHMDSLNSDTQYDEDERWNQALFVQHSWQGEVFSTELGLRHDKNEQFGSENTFNGALTYHLDADNDLILSYAEGFRAPTFNNLYWPDFCDPSFGCSSSSNPNLKPESSKTYELQWRSQLAEKTLLQASLYRTDIEDAIVFVDIPRNVQKARINGFEASLQQELFGWQGSAALSIIDPRDRDSGHTLPRRAKRTLSLDLDRQLGDIGIGATWQAFSRSYDTLANTEELPGYGLLSLRSSWQATPEITLGLKVDNVLDKEYTRAIHWTGAEYMGEGRTALVSVTWTPSL